VVVSKEAHRVVHSVEQLVLKKVLVMVAKMEKVLVGPRVHWLVSIEVALKDSYKVVEMVY